MISFAFVRYFDESEINIHEITLKRETKNG